MEACPSSVPLRWLVGKFASAPAPGWAVFPGHCPQIGGPTLEGSHCGKAPGATPWRGGMFLLLIVSIYTWYRLRYIHLLRLRRYPSIPVRSTFKIRSRCWTKLNYFLAGIKMLLKCFFSFELSIQRILINSVSIFLFPQQDNMDLFSPISIFWNNLTSIGVSLFRWNCPVKISERGHLLERISWASFSSSL